MIRDNGGWEEFEMIQIKEFPCENKRQAEMEEDRIMREMKATLNAQRAYLTPEEQKEYKKEYGAEYHKQHIDEIHQKQFDYRVANKDAIKARYSLYRKENDDLIKKQAKVYRKAHKNTISQRYKEYYTANIDKIKKQKSEYRKVNKEALNEKTKVYNEINKEALKEKAGMKYTCECGAITCKGHKARHERSQKHIKFINNIIL